MTGMAIGGPGWIPDAFAAIALLVAMASAALIVQSRQAGRTGHVDIDASHLIMGVAMAGMLVPSLAVADTAFWTVVYSLACLWFAWRCYRLYLAPPAGVPLHSGAGTHHLSHYPAHLVMVAAMLFMYVAPAAAGAHSYRTLSLLFLLALIASGVGELDTAGRGITVSAAAAGPAGAAPVGAVETAPRPAARIAERPLAVVASACHVAMCLTMGYMLITML